MATERRSRRARLADRADAAADSYFEHAGVLLVGYVFCLAVLPAVTALPPSYFTTYEGVVVAAAPPVLVSVLVAYAWVLGDALRTLSTDDPEQ